MNSTSVLLRASAFVLLAASSGAIQEPRPEPWTIELDLRPFGPGSGARHNLVPVLAGDKVLVSSTLALYAVDARSGRLAWQAGPLPGWSELATKDQEILFKGIAFDSLRVEPAAAGNVALAVLQLPRQPGPGEDWKGIHLSTELPERRLFAFDLGTGAELWNHAPPPDWDGLTGPLAQQLNVAGPPVVAGSCVVVPCYRTQEDIEVLVACYELASGALRWSTSITHGQREKNRAGRWAIEFAAPPVGVAGERVIVQTDLGCVAALELATGSLLWRSDYRQTPLPKARSYGTPARMAYWRPSPPLVSGELVLCTPFDSPDLVAFRLEDGQQLWASDSTMLQNLEASTPRLAFDSLLGVDRDTIYLGGARVSALRKADGLASGSPWKTLWTFPLDENPGSALLPQAELTADAVLIPRAKECLVLDRQDGTPRAPLPIRESGRIRVTDGALFLLSGEHLSRVPR